MTVIRKSKKKIILSVFLGAFGMGVLCFLAFFLCMKQAGVKPSELLSDKNRQETASLVCLARDVKEGVVLSEKDLEEVKIQTPKGKFGEQTVSQYRGKCLISSMKKGSVLSAELVYDSPKIADDERLLNLSYVKLSDKMEAGDYVDIRISFQNGSDYVLLSRKKIYDISGNGAGEDYGETNNALWLQVNEEEILRLASAVVDTLCQENCEIYAIEYVSEMQKEATITYPVNETVRNLIQQDPNITELAQGTMSKTQEEELRKALDEKLQDE